jgi:hypothetical protein
MLRSQSAKNIAGKATDEQLVKQAILTCNKAIDQIETSSQVADGNNAAAAARSLVDSLAVVSTALFLYSFFITHGLSKGY